MTFNTLIIGLGDIGMKYDLYLDRTKYIYSHANAVEKHKEFKLVGGVDSCIEATKIFNKHYKLKAYSSVKESLSITKPEIIIISVPTNNHFDVINSILGFYKPKVILCEKPLASSFKQAKYLVQKCDELGISLFVNFIRRADPACIKIKNMIQNAEIKTPVKGTAWYTYGLAHNGSHIINLLEFWLGEIREYRILENRYNHSSYFDGEDLFLDFDKGTVILQSASEQSFSHYTIELLSQSGRLRYDQGGELINWQISTDDPCFSDKKLLSSKPVVIESSMDKYQLNILDQLLLSIERKPSFICTGEEALSSLKVTSNFN